MKTSSMNKFDDIAESYADLTVDKKQGFYAMESFQKILYLERKRRERSLKPMLLMLVDIARTFEEDREPAVVKIVRVLASLTRETDIKGWYSEGQIIGVLFTELNLFNDQEMLKKIKNGLERDLQPDLMQKLELSIHVFPQGQENGQCDPAENHALYPDVRRKYSLKRGAFLAKRAIDIVGSLSGLILFLPLFLFIPILIRLTSPGPILFRQERLGLYGKKFIFLKFRSMYVNNDATVHQEYVKKLIAGSVEESGGENGNNGGNGRKKPVFKITNDRRITPIGQLLRKTSMDELPQFINVLRGDMSLVGPRPAIPYEVQNYDLWHRCRVIEVKPGITGLWQIMGRSSTTFNEMVRLDIKYVREWSIWLDLKILVMTPWAVLKGKGAY
jgi:exopolysaccharide biosynthesis polyprenyl glycosylphosphotransferase